MATPELKLFNTMTARKEALRPLQAGKISMYCCGITPYSNTHVGHARTFFSYDLLYRTLRDLGLDVRWARNITDVDDKIIRKANEEGSTCKAIVDRYVDEQNETFSAFSLLRPDFEPKVTESIPGIIEVIGKLVGKELAYASASGVYFRVRKFGAYGKLSKNRIDDLRKGARIEVDESKEDALDFALWKFAKAGEISWPSPWGDGRPGWHVECSAMIHGLFGDSIDIHMGGRDLIFPHHECEIAQSEGMTGQPFSSLWLHTGMVTLYSEKMSKSTQHFVSVSDFLSKYPPEVLRLLFLSASYSQPLDFTYELAGETLKKLARLYRFALLVEQYVERFVKKGAEAEVKIHAKEIFGGLETLADRMREPMRDDLNSSAALAVFFEFAKGVNSGMSEIEKTGAALHPEDCTRLDTHWAAFRRWLSEATGLLSQSPKEFFASLQAFKLTGELSEERIAQRLAERKSARDAKDFKAADAIRDELAAQGILIQDGPAGTRWTVQL